jgi:hypothetical protein
MIQRLRDTSKLKQLLYPMKLVLTEPIAQLLGLYLAFMYVFPILGRFHLF